MSSNTEDRLRLLILNTKSSTRNPNSYMTLAVAEGFRAHLGRDSVRIITSQNLMHEALQNPPDALICFGGEEIQLDVILQFKKMRIPCGGWLTEDPYEIEFNLRNQDIYDIIFTNEGTAVSKYQPGKAVHLPLAASRELCYYPVRESCRYDVCIAGTAWPDRVAFCRQLREKLPNVRWKIILQQVEGIPKFKFPNPLIETDYRLSIQDVSRVFNQSKITVSLKRQYSGWQPRQPRAGKSPAPRIFETAMAGTAQLVQVVEGDEIGDFFENGKEIVSFISADECAYLVRKLLDDDDRRRQIADAGQKRAVMDHSYANRAKSIIDWVGVHGTRGTRIEPPRRLLVCVHSSTQSKTMGGTEVLTEDFVERLKPFYSIFLLVPAKRDDRTYWRLTDMSTGKIEEEECETAGDAMVFVPSDFARFKRILLSKRIGLVHFQHLLHYPLSLPTAASELGVPYTLTWTDFYPVCHKFTLLNNFGVYCHPDEIPIETCDICLNTTHGVPPGAQSARRVVTSKIMLGAEKIICLSNPQRELIRRVFPEVDDRIEVIEPIEPYDEHVEPARPPEKQNGADPLKVAITGNFAKQKGADVAVLIMRYYRNSPEITFHILGRVDPEYDGLLELAGLKSASNVHILGGYKPSQRFSIYDGMHVALFLSIWPEGYPLTLYDLRKARVPCIATDLGQPAVEIQNGVNGWKVPPHDPGAVVSILNQLIKDRGTLETIRAKLAIKTEPDKSYAARLGHVFDNILKEKRALEGDDLLARKQIEWLSERTEPLGRGTSWTNTIAPILVAEQGSAIFASATGLGLPTPREVFRRFMFYSRQRGLMGTLRIVVEWLTK